MSGFASTWSDFVWSSGILQNIFFVMLNKESHACFKLFYSMSHVIRFFVHIIFFSNLVVSTHLFLVVWTRPTQVAWHRVLESWTWGRSVRPGTLWWTWGLVRWHQDYLPVNCSQICILALLWSHELDDVYSVVFRSPTLWAGKQSWIPKVISLILIQWSPPTEETSGTQHALLLSCRC